MESEVSCSKCDSNSPRRPWWMWPLLLSGLMAGMDALEICRRVRQNASVAGTLLIPVLSHASSRQREAFRQAGVDDVLLKPVSSADLLRALGLAQLHSEDW